LEEYNIEEADKAIGWANEIKSIVEKALELVLIQ